MIHFKNQRNPILPLEIHVPDSEAHVMSDGKLYIYGSYDDNDEAYCSEKYHVVSTSDMENWYFHEESFNGNDVPWYRDPNAPKYPGIDWYHPTPFLKKMLDDMGDQAAGLFDIVENTDRSKCPALLYAPDCIEKNGKYYLYFCMDDDSEGVAVSEKPYGPFKNPVQLPCGGIDPAIFVDDDGQAYYYWGQLYSHGVKLNDDMISFDEMCIVDNLVTEQEHFFHEGSSMRKIGDTYYYVYADMERGKPTSLGYSTSKSPLGPFTYQGIIIDNDGCDPESWNNHGSIECVNGQWYVFYHRCSRNKQNYRRLCVEKININSDGTIDEVKMTSQGIGEPFKPGEKIMGFQACGLQGSIYIDAQHKKGRPEETLTNICAGDRAVFRYVRSNEEFQYFRMKAQGSGTAEIWMNQQLAGTVVIKNGEQLCDKIHMDSGEYELEIRFTEAENLEVDWLEMG